MPEPSQGRSSSQTTAIKAVANIIQPCSCSNTAIEFEPNYKDIRSVTYEYMAHGDEPNSLGLSNLVWAWGAAPRPCVAEAPLH
jgi:hypothetical protein